MSSVSSEVLSPASTGSGSPYSYPELTYGAQPANGTGAGTSLNGSTLASEDPNATFEKVATVVAIYKVALFWAERVKADPNSYTAEEQGQKLAALEIAEGMLLNITKHADQLSGASQQQLHILQCELLNQGVSNRLQIGLSPHQPVPHAESDTVDRSLPDYGSDDPFLASAQGYAEEGTQEWTRIKTIGANPLLRFTNITLAIFID